jgi:aspartate aminotransferase
MIKKITSPSFFIGRKDEKLISFGSGQPDLPPPKACYCFLKDYTNFEYGIVQGNLNLREEVAKYYPNANADEIIITNGASEGIDLSLRALYKENAKILIPKPYYYSYPHNVYLAHMNPVFYNLINGKIDFYDFKEKVKDCRAVIINSPSNPTGTIQDIETLKKIEKLTEKLGVYIISDEVYKDLIYVRSNYLIKGENVLTINSFSKTFSMCGYRVGYIYCRKKDWTKKIVEMKTHTSMNTSIIGQEMAYQATLVPRDFVEEQRKIWEDRRDLIYESLKNLGLDLFKPEGAFYVFPKMKNPSKVVHDLYYKYNMIVYDGDWFGDNTRVRFSYALDTSKIKEGMRRLKLYLDNEYKEN